MLAIIVCHFNFAGYERPRQNLMRFIRQMKSFGYPVYGAEAYLEGSKPFTLTTENWIQFPVSQDQIVFQKEALLNAAEKIVPTKYDSLAWIDPDLWFDNPNWFNETEELLKTFKVVQLFSKAFWTSKTGEIVLEKSGFVYSYKNNGPFKSMRNYHPGFAWAARRELWSECGGIYFKSPLGSCDGLSAHAFLANPKIWSGTAGLNRADYYEWYFKVVDWIKNDAGFRHGDIYHEWHGDLIGRAYNSRRKIIESYDLSRVLAQDKNKLLIWTKEAPEELKEAVRNYFHGRSEDG